jgi:hypothetical protein
MSVLYYVNLGQLYLKDMLVLSAETKALKKVLSRALLRK